MIYSYVMHYSDYSTDNVQEYSVCVLFGSPFLIIFSIGYPSKTYTSALEKNGWISGHFNSL